MAEIDAPVAMATIDPAMFATLRTAITKYHLKGWSAMTVERARQVAAQQRPNSKAQGQ